MTLSISAPANREPSSVRGIFERKNGTPVTVYFQKAQAGVWTGQATFVESGEYTLSYLIVDGESYPLPKNETVNMWKTVNITLGMSVVVETTSKTNFILDPMADVTQYPHMKKLSMQVKIYDNNGNPLEMLSDVQLNYPMTTSTTAKMNTNLKWDSTKKAYVGEFQTTPGTYAFGSVTVGENIISRANGDAPVFTIIPPYEPKFVEIGNNGAYDVYQFGKGEVKITFTEAPTAEAVATFVNKATGEEIVVAGVGVGAETKTFTFTLPNDVPDGTWVLKTVGLSGVYVDDHFYGGDNGDLYEVPKMVEALNYNAETNTSAVVITVLRTINVKFESVFNTNNPMNFTSVDTSGSMQVGWYGKTGNNITGKFMDSYQVSAGSLKVVFTDGAGNPIDPHFAISNIKLKYTYALDSKYGGYRSTSFDNDMTAGTYSFTATGDGKTYQTSSDMTFQIAARYNPTLSYTITVPGAENGQLVELTTIENAPVVEVWSVKPTVTITDITLDGNGAYSVDLNTTGSIADDVTTSGGCLGVGATNKFTTHKDHLFASKNTEYIPRISDSKLEAWLYFKCSHADIDGYEDKNFKTYKPHTYAYNGGNGVPAATLTITGMGNAASATLEFAKTGGGQVEMYKKYTEDNPGQANTTAWANPDSTDRTNAYEWTNGTTTCKRFIGRMDNGAGSNDSDTKVVAGELTAQTLVLSYDINGDGVAETHTVTISKVIIHNDH